MNKKEIKRQVKLRLKIIKHAAEETGLISNEEKLTTLTASQFF